MNHSKLMWMLGGTAGIFLAGAGSVARLALSEYELRIRVSDSNGALEGAWVALDDREVVTTNLQGIVVLKGRRYEFDSALLTVSDTSVSTLHLSKTLRTQISWNPFRSESGVEVNLPIIESDPILSDSGSTEDSRVDIPLPFEVTNSNGKSDTVPAVSPIVEEELSDSGAVLGINARLEDFLQKSGSQNSSVLACLLAGLSQKLCDSQVNAVAPPFSESPSEIVVAVVSPEQNFSESMLLEASPVAVSSKSIDVSSESTGESEKSEKILVGRNENALSREPIRIEVSLAGRPLEGALVFMSRLKDNRVRELGRSSSEGVLLVKSSPDFWGETVTVFHDCCAPRTLPAKIVKQAGEARVRLELQSGTGLGVLLRQEAYGHLRKVGLFELASSQGKLSVSGQDGFALYNSTKTPDQLPSKILLRQGKPSEFFTRPSDMNELRSKPLTYLVAPDEPYLPALAILEKTEGRPFQGLLKSSPLRRWRRDFMARLMQQSSLRSQVSSECEARINAAGESATDVVANGWSRTQLAGEWDFLLAIDYNDATQSVSVSAKNSEGRSFFEKEFRFGKETSQAPESVSRRAFQSFVESIPFEAHVLQQEGNVVELSFSSLSLFGLKADSPIALYQQSGSLSDEKTSELAALAVVVSAEAGQAVKARITHWNSRSRKTEILPDVVRALKISEDAYRKEALRSSMAKAATRSSGRSL